MKLLSLKLVVTTPSSYQWVGYTKRQKSFQGLAIYGHEVLMSLQRRAKFLGTYSTTSVTESVIRDFNMTWYLVISDFLFWTCSQWRSSEISVKSSCVFVNESWSCRPSISTTYAISSHATYLQFRILSINTTWNLWGTYMRTLSLYWIEQHVAHKRAIVDAHFYWWQTTVSDRLLINGLN
jgi:hypothetical protein